MSVNLNDAELKMAKMANLATEIAEKIKASGTDLPIEELEESTRKWVANQINQRENLILNVMNADQRKGWLNRIIPVGVEELSKETPSIHVTPNQILGQIYLEAIKRSKPALTTSSSSSPVQNLASTAKPIPILPPNPEQRRFFLLKSLQSLSPLDEYAQTENERLANKSYNRLLKDCQPQIQNLINRLNEGDTSEPLLTETKGLLDDLNAVNEFMLIGSKNYPKNKGFESTQQWAAIIDESSKASLQTSTLKLPPVAPSPFSRLDRDNEGNFIGINQQGKPEKLQGTHSFVILPEAPNEVRIGQGHSAISQGQDVLFAGEITFIEKSGKTIMAEWTNDSGHYATDSSTGHHTLYAVDSAGKPLFDSDKFAIRAQSKPMNFAPLPSQSLANSQTTMSTTNKLNPSAGIQGPTFPNFQTASSSSSTASSDWGTGLGAVNAQFNKDKNSDTVSSSGQFQTFSYNTQRAQQLSMKEEASIPTIQQNQSTTATTKEEATKTPRLAKH